MRKILILCTLLTTTSIVKGQFSFGGSVYGGISALISDRESERPEIEYWWEHQGSFALGGFANFKVNKTIFLQMDLLYNQQNYSEGFKINEGLHNYRSYNFNRKAHYISIPILIQFKSNKIQLGIGLQNSFVVYQSTKYSSFGYSNSLTEFEAINSKDLLNYNPELIGSIGFHLSKKLIMELRYSYGLKNNLNAEEGQVYHARTSQLLLGLSYQFWNSAKAIE